MENMRKGKETVSVSTNELVQGSHVFKISGYSILLEKKCSDPIQSAPFEVGGHNWAINFYPQYFNQHSSVFIEQLSEGNGMRAKIRFDLLDQLGKPSEITSHDNVLYMFGGKNTECGYDFFVSNKELSSYLHNDSLTIRCTLRVLKSSVIQQVQPPFREVLTWKIRSDLGKLLESGEGADVIFNVKGELFPAHKCILAARAPFPEIEEPFGNNGEQLSRTVLVQKLLLVADHYLLDQLKIICEDILREEISDNNVVQLLALSEQHNCGLLKDTCLGYLADPKTLALVMLTDEFLQLMIDYPSVLKDIKENISHPIVGTTLSDLQNSIEGDSRSTPNSIGSNSIIGEGGTTGTSTDF
ncbi:BTB/POZ and MATH domain-containing protein 1-like [Carex rostrata]